MGKRAELIAMRIGWTSAQAIKPWTEETLYFSAPGPGLFSRPSASIHLPRLVTFDHFVKKRRYDSETGPPLLLSWPGVCTSPCHRLIGVLLAQALAMPGMALSLAVPLSCEPSKDFRCGDSELAIAIC